jgi:hypothetical protein
MMRLHVANFSLPFFLFFSPDPFWRDSYHASLDRLAERTARKLSSLKMSLNAAIEAEERAERETNLSASLINSSADGFIRGGIKDLSPRCS